MSVDEQVPLAARVLVGALLLLTGATVSEVSRRAADGRLRRNGVAGIRTRSTMRSDAAWQAGHEAARGLSDASGAVFAVSGVAAIVLRAAPLWTGAVLAGVVVAAVLLLVAAHRAGTAGDAS